MKIISCVADKGGVGKTMLACNLAYNLSVKTKADGSPVRVLLIDFDAQGNTSAFCSAQREDIAGASGIFREDPILDYVPAVFDGEASETLFISPVNSKFSPAIISVSNLSENEYLLEDALNGEDFDFVIIDCPPTPDSLVKRNALCCSDEMIVPVTADINSINGVPNIVKIVARSNRKNPVIRVVRNQYRKSNRSVNGQQIEWLEHLENQIEEFKQTKAAKRKFEFVIEDLIVPYNVIASDALSNRCPAVYADPRSGASVALMQLSDKYIK